MTITAAVDGSALHNPGPAGWCWYIDDGCWAAGGWKEGTNNRGELTALAELLCATADLPEEHLQVLCDSQYVINSVTKWMPGWKRKGWKKRDGKPVLNVDILKEIDQLLVGRSVNLEWVKGHSGHDMNEAADQRARAAATAYQRGTQVPMGPGFTGAGSGAGSTSTQAQQSLQKSAYEQEGLFDLSASTEVPGESHQVNFEAAAEAALTILRRAAHRAERGSGRALKVLLNDALGADLPVPDGLSAAQHKLRVVGATAVAQFYGDGWAAMAVWDLSAVAGGATTGGEAGGASGAARLVGWNAGSR